MAIPLNVLIIEDSKNDTELLLHQLRRGGYDPRYVRVETAERLDAELASHAWQIILSDYSMPRFDAFAALALLHKTKLDIPFIIVSGTISEDQAVSAMKAGAHDYVLKDNLKRLIPAVQRELQEAKVRRERHHAEETIRRLAYIDPVTELPNRFRFLEFVRQAIEDSEGKNPLALLLMDLQRFKDVNDTLGHNRGDMLLRLVGRRLQSVLRTPDVVARLGGDEFGILLQRLSATIEVNRVIEDLREALAAPFLVDGIPIAVEGATGVAFMPDHSDNPDTLLQFADVAMYRAKNRASDFAIYDPNQNRHSPDRLALLAELRDGIERNQLELHYQPKVEIATGRVAGTEVLVRWQHPRKGLLAPDKFIPSAEYTGLIGPLTIRVLGDALAYAQVARHDGIRLSMSVNLSARSLHDQRLLDSVRATFEKSGAKPEQLTLEITESAIVLDPKHAEDSLFELSDMGVRLAIDDFGTGYTSIGSLKKLPIDEIKIDRSFVAGVLSDKDDATIVRSVIDLGHNLGIRVVAEGVETKAIFDALAELGCDEAQGYYIARPQHPDSLRRWLTTSPWKLEMNP